MFLLNVALDGRLKRERTKNVGEDVLLWELCLALPDALHPTRLHRRSAARQPQFAFLR
jgi:hypothetical protein